jgi:hypothetical protein
VGGSGGGGGGIDMAAGDDCPAPQLLVGVTNTHNGDDGGGRVARISLAGGQRRACRTSSGGGLIGWHVAAVSAFAGGVAALSDDHAYLVDSQSDVLRWQRTTEVRSGYLAIDAFALQDQAGKPILAAAYGPNTSSPAIREIFVLDADGVAPAKTPWCIQVSGCATALPLSLGIYGMTADPAQPTHLLALDTSLDVAAWSVDPYTPARATVVGSPGLPLRTVAAARFGTMLRYVWIGNDAPNRIVWRNDAGGLNGPVRCSDDSCREMVGAVPDPTSSNHFFVLCGAPTASERKVIDLDTQGHCSAVMDGATFGIESMLTSLGVGE